MLTKVIIPKMGMSTVEVDLVHWFVKPGDTLNVGDPIAEVESEKANFTIEAEVTGKVSEILVELNETVDVGTVICLLETE
ncbi:biotin/lipoyl-containing protein [Paenibacillus eucommiae]|uniref:Pyruvate/2-oxoglutarate dehydrogenase complex dihydrolipoamide acyltransferase (E2) component n=1 Tax=Paenibacillus eucommiae TaxID=1355755 RepID=A0ABS4J2F3_9BACL|nr:biotin/lipoyl-containing protein [Paenibacillus eucommiae]MBP1994002.1 pyruvate/2-oxoglutarate dehydrogenase complex dihydrolipoamide acyltransferase (E2) component [Paenibacillus eucommiae]